MYDFTRELKAGESLLWSGKPNNVNTLDEEYKTSIIIKLIITAIVVLGFMAIYVISGLNDPNGGVKYSLLIIIAIIGFLAGTGSFNQVKKFNNEYSYAITNQRIIIHTDSCKSIDFSDIKKATAIKDAANQTSVLINDAASSNTKKVRLLAERCGMNEGKSFVSKIALYAISNAEEAINVLANQLPQFQKLF